MKRYIEPSYQLIRISSNDVLTVSNDDKGMFVAYGDLEEIPNVIE